MSFATPKDRVYQLTLADAYTSGSGEMVLTSLPSGGFTFPIYFAAITAASYGTGVNEVTASYTATGISGNTLTGVAVLAGSTDQNFSAGDYVEERNVAQYVIDLNTATAAIQTALNSVPSGVLKGVDGVLEAATAGTDYVTPSGCVTSFTGDGTVLGNSGSTGGVTASLVSHAKNTVLAGPSSGSNAAPTFRALVLADLPSESAYSVLGNNTGSSASPSALQSLILGTPSITDTGILLQSTASTNGYEQVILQNTSSGAAASTDLVLNNNSGTATTYYIDLGINSSGYTGSGSLNIASAGYLLMVSGDLVIATGGLNAIHVVVDSGTTDALTVQSYGAVNQPAMSAPGSPANYDSWSDSTQLCRAARDGGLIHYRAGLIYSQIANVTATAASYTSFVSTSGAIGSVSLPAGFLNVVGRKLRITGGGYGTTASSSPGNFGIALYLGASCVANNSEPGLNSSKTNAPFAFDITVTTKATGTSGKLDITGFYNCNNGNALNGSPCFAVANSSSGATNAQAPQTQITLDLTQAYTLDFGAVLNETGNSITLSNLDVEVLA